LAPPPQPPTHKNGRPFRFFVESPLPPFLPSPQAFVLLDHSGFGFSIISGWSSPPPSLDPVGNSFLFFGSLTLAEILVIYSRQPEVLRDEGTPPGTCFLTTRFYLAPTFLPVLPGFYPLRGPKACFFSSSPARGIFPSRHQFFRVNLVQNAGHTSLLTQSSLSVPGLIPFSPCATPPLPGQGDWVSPSLFQFLGYRALSLFFRFTPFPIGFAALVAFPIGNEISFFPRDPCLCLFFSCPVWVSSVRVSMQNWS